MIKYIELVVETVHDSDKYLRISQTWTVHDDVHACSVPVATLALICLLGRIFLGQVLVFFIVVCSCEAWEEVEIPAAFVDLQIVLSRDLSSDVIIFIIVLKSPLIESRIVKLFAPVQWEITSERSV